MKRYTGQLLSTKVDRNGNRITQEAIDELIRQQPVVPVTINFNKDIPPIGHTVSFSKIDQGVLCTFDVEDQIAIDVDMYIVPMGIIKTDHYEKEAHVFDNFELLQTALTKTPSDDTISKIEKVPGQINVPNVFDGLKSWIYVTKFLKDNNITRYEVKSNIAEAYIETDTIFVPPHLERIISGLLKG